MEHHVAAGCPLSLAHVHHLNSASDTLANIVGPEIASTSSVGITLKDMHSETARQQLINDRFALQNAVRTTLLQGVGGGILFLGAFLTFRQFQLNQQAQITERFTRAVDQLGSDKLAVRVGGISALGRIARDSTRDHESVIEILAAYIREQGRDVRQSGESIPADRVPMLRGDLQAAATIVGYRPEKLRHEESRRISLREASLGRVHLRGAHYEEIALTNADFRTGTLAGVTIQVADIGGIQRLPSSVSRRA